MSRTSSTARPGSQQSAVGGVLARDQSVGSLRVHVAEPDAPSGVGVVLYPTVMGLDEAMRACARDLAQAGLTAVVWDPYDGRAPGGGIMEMLARSKACEDERAVADLTRIVDHMQDDLGLRSIAGVGWCFGGRIALLHAGTDPRVGALAAYNPTMYADSPVLIAGIGPTSRADFPGQTMDEFQLAGAIEGPVQVCRPERDFTQPAEYRRLVDALFARSGPTFYEYYPGAGHGFSHTPGEANERAQQFAWATTVSLFLQTAAGQDDA